MKIEGVRRKSPLFRWSGWVNRNENLKILSGSYTEPIFIGGFIELQIM
jgi:hypothetical protein